MQCENSSLCREVEMDDVDKIADHVENLRTPIENYCQQQQEEDGLCELFALSLELAQRKTALSLELAQRKTALSLEWNQRKTDRKENAIVVDGWSEWFG